MEQTIRQAAQADASRVAEIIITNYRIQFYPIFRKDAFYFAELNVGDAMQQYREDPLILENTYVFDEDDIIKGVLRMNGTEIEKLFVEPAFQSQQIGTKLLRFAVERLGADRLWVLEKNPRAIRFYERNGFRLTEQNKLEEDTTEYLLQMRK